MHVILEKNVYNKSTCLLQNGANEWESSHEFTLKGEIRWAYKANFIRKLSTI